MQFSKGFTLQAGLLIAASLIATPVFAQSAGAASGAMAGMDMSASSASTGDVPSTTAFQAADHSMMEGMSSVPYTGHADRDFVTHMIPHHKGAVAMAKVELKYGKDAKLRALAKDIIAAQDKEIAFMNQWLAAHPQSK